ncbi:TolC family protein [Budviciaceae bacterium BWR-B9]|uniref:TolC family protein n=1 Tax=Limnobaculum allomyrinae TaxID=2791986 RepID=A0ABS1ILN4_9GAMM|nr:MULTISPECIES: TolC family protein [Limnobaculum]MBK5142255.1 TolC family protein [Limnobaculum allomyrinae]MBV7690861.1 TolC family protein [Limnobaculum sp. M2-1]
MIRYNEIMFALVVSYFSTLSAETSAETLNETLQMAVNRSPTIKYHSGKIASAESTIGEARSGWLPNVSVNAGNEVMRSNKKDSDGSNTYSVKVDQTLFDFGRVGDQVEYAEHNKSSEVYTAHDEAEVLSSKVSETYLNILKYEQLIDINKKNTIEHRNILGLAEARASGGVDSRGDVEQVEVRIKGLDAELANYEAQLKAAQEDYYILVGKRPSGLSIPDVSPLKAKLAVKMKERISASPRVEAIRANRDAAAAEYSYTSKSWLPALSVSVSQGKLSTNGENDTVVMLNVNSNIFDGGGAIYRSKGAAQRVESARWNIEKSIEDLSTKVSQMYQEALSQENQSNIYAQRILHSQEVKELYHEQYKVNRRSVLDLLNSEQELFQTMSNKVNADFNFRVLLIRVFSELGEINKAFNIKVKFEEDDGGNLVSNLFGGNKQPQKAAEPQIAETIIPEPLVIPAAPQAVERRPEIIYSPSVQSTTINKPETTTSQNVQTTAFTKPDVVPSGNVQTTVINKPEATTSRNVQNIVVNRPEIVVSKPEITPSQNIQTSTIERPQVSIPAPNNNNDGYITKPYKYSESQPAQTPAAITQQNIRKESTVNPAIRSTPKGIDDPLLLIGVRKK